MTVAYGVLLAVSVLLLLAHCLLVKRKELWTTLLYIAIAVALFGHLLLSTAKTLDFALAANKVAYLGTVYIFPCMCALIIKLCGFNEDKRLIAVLFSFSTVVYAMVLTTGHLPWYYKTVDLAFVDGAAKLVKEYGPLHTAYLVHVIAYTVAMIVATALSVIKKIGNPKYAGLMASIVCINVVIWVAERHIPRNFEFLTVSYVMSQMMFFFLHWMMQDYVKVNEIGAVAKLGGDVEAMPMDVKIEKVMSTLQYGETLSTREKEILEFVLNNVKRKDIASQLHLSENTVKTYTRTLYSKLGVSSRAELYALLVEKDTPTKEKD